MTDPEIEKLAVALSALCAYDEMAIHVSKLLEVARNEGAVGAFGAASEHYDMFVNGESCWQCICGHVLGDRYQSLILAQQAQRDHILSLTPAAATAWLDEHDKLIAGRTRHEMNQQIGEFTGQDACSKSTFQMLTNWCDERLRQERLAGLEDALKLARMRTESFVETLRDTTTIPQWESRGSVGSTTILRTHVAEAARIAWLIGKRIAELSRPKEPK